MAIRLTTYHPYVVTFRFSDFEIEDGDLPKAQVMVRWLKEHAKGKYEIICCRSLTHFNQHEIQSGVNREEILGVNFLFFEDEKDAMLFKLAWTGRG